MKVLVNVLANIQAVCNLIYFILGLHVSCYWPLLAAVTWDWRSWSKVNWSVRPRAKATAVSTGYL